MGNLDPKAVLPASGDDFALPPHFKNGPFHSDSVGADRRNILFGSVNAPRTAQPKGAFFSELPTDSSAIVADLESVFCKV